MPTEPTSPAPPGRLNRHGRLRRALFGSAPPPKSISEAIASAIPTLVSSVLEDLAQAPLRSQRFFPSAAPENVDNSSTQQGPEHPPIEASGTPLPIAHHPAVDEPPGCSPTSECNELMQEGRALDVTPAALDASTFEAPMRVPRSEAQRCGRVQSASTSSGTAQRTVEAHQAGDQFFLQ
ncbi:hypothetical protein FA13DRAFT_1059738 [Coprinellus micaceus]|uniref:Uncharacterized protein n=1 Tax=Coprinellus micaceus TaxID=71717 RepID=A0A4Y7RL21_COPMI|nr:hypothetical protein FA13DRAFT_1059738 [Coprinellus micaceus]